MKNHSKTIAALSQPQREMIEQGMNVVVGLDLGDRHSHLCLLDLEGNIVERHRIRTSVAAFKKFFDEWAPMRVVFEAGTHSLWVWRLLKRLGHQPLMADTHPSAAMPSSLQDTLGPLLLVIQHLSDEIRRYDKKIEKLGAEKYPQTLRMRTIPGVGPITSLAFVLNLDNDQTKLKTSRAAGPRMGLRPKQRSSGKSAPQLSITKSGDPMLRRLLVQCGQYMLGHFGTDSRLRRWGLGLAARGGRAAKRKAVVAVARKLAILLHVLWKREVDFDPFYGRKGEQPAAQAATAPTRPATAG